MDHDLLFFSAQITWRYCGKHIFRVHKASSINNQIFETEIKEKDVKQPHLLFTALGLLSLASTGHAAIISSDLATFSGGGGGSAGTGVYTLDSISDSVFTLQNSVADGTSLDGADDGYAFLHRSNTISKVNVVKGAYGTIVSGDVGKLITVDAGVRHETGTTSDWTLQLDGSDIGGEGTASFLRINTFSSGDGSSDVNYQLSTFAAGAQNAGRTTGALTYTVQAGDIGKVLGFQLKFFDSSNNGSGEGSRNIYIDSISYSAAIPEPATLGLVAAFGGAVLFVRRRFMI